MRVRRVFHYWVFVGGVVFLSGVLAPLAWGAERNIVLFDYTNPQLPTVYWSQALYLDKDFPRAVRGFLPSSPREFEQLLGAHFKRAHDRNRFLTHPLNHETVEVYVITEDAAEGRTVSIADCREEGRDIHAVREVQALTPAETVPAEGPGSHFYFVRKEFPFQFMRANLTLEVSALGRQATAQFITGPQEDVFLGANLPVDYFNLDGSVMPLDRQPREFYLSVDYIPLGDRWIKDFQPLVHLFVKVSENPFDSIGIGLGGRLPDMWDFMDLSNVTVTMNLLRTQGNGTSEFHWVCQLGYNLFSVFPGLFE